MKKFILPALFWQLFYPCHLNSSSYDSFEISDLSETSIDDEAYDDLYNFSTESLEEEDCKSNLKESKSQIANNLGFAIRYSFLDGIDKITIKVPINRIESSLRKSFLGILPGASYIEIILFFKDSRIEIGHIANVNDTAKKQLEAILQKFLDQSEICYQPKIKDYFILLGKEILDDSLGERKYEDLQSLLQLGISPKKALMALRTCNNLYDATEFALGFDELNNGGDENELWHINEEYGHVLSCGYGIAVYCYIFNILPKLTQYCAFCGDYIGGDWPVKRVCNKMPCNFAVQTELIKSTFSNLNLDPQVVKLLILAAKAAGNSERWHLIFKPFPNIVYENQDLFAGNRALLLRYLNDLSENNGRSITEDISAEDSQIISNLLHWIISSNPTFLIHIEFEQSIKCLLCHDQYLVVSASLDKEEAFRRKREEYGSRFAFHGSDFENWHSILRNGLYVASGTELQVNGAVHGAGIYLTPNAHYASLYSKLNELTEFEYDIHYPACIALCEVINQGIRNVGNKIWVVEDPDNVILRFLFVFNKKEAIDSNVDTEEIYNGLNFQIQKCVKEHDIWY